MELKSMKSPPADSKEEKAESVALSRPEYPYGLQINLNEDSLEALGIVTLPAVGQKMILNAKVEVCSVSQYSSQNGGADNQSVCLQITDMALAADKAKPDMQKKLYGG